VVAAGDNPSTALVAVNAADGTVFQAWGDARGATFTGTWIQADDGALVSRVSITGADGNRFDLSIRHRLSGADTMTITLELPEPIVVEMVRAGD